MSDHVEAEEISTELVLAHTGELIDLTNERAIAKAYKEVDGLQKKLRDALGVLRLAMKLRSEALGTKTMHLEGIGKVTLSGDRKIEYPDPLALAEALREAECPEEVISEIVVETISHKVDGVRAKQAAAANPAYKEIIEQHQRVIEPLPSVTIK